MVLRDFLWEYPVNLKKLYIATTPFSHVILFIITAVLFFTVIYSPTFADYINREKKNTFVEGVVGGSTRLNPLYLSSNQLDRDIQDIIFSKFIEIDDQGNPQASLAQNWNIASDQRTYTFEIRDQMYWQDGVKLTADDVVFTFEFSQELFKKYSIDTFGASLSDVKVQKVSDLKVKFILPEVNATFFESIAVYIVPKHILENTTPDSYAFTQFDKYPTSSGPYYVDKNNADSIILAKNPYTVQPVKIENVEFRIFPDYSTLEYAFKSNKIDGFGTYNSSNANFVNEYESSFTKYSMPLPFRKKILFFNTRLPQFANSSIRKGLTYLMNKEKLVSDLSIDGRVSQSPLPVTSWAYVSDLPYLKYNQKLASDELKLAGYTKNATSGFYTSSDGKILSLDLTYLDNPSNKRLVDYLVSEYEKEGVLLNPVSKTYDQMTREVLASRDFEIILYEIEVSIDPDQYNIWHSLKIDYPNLNISGFKFDRVDVYLERARKSLDKKFRYENYVSFQKAILTDTPAIYLYEPSYTYIVRKDIKNFNNSDAKFPQKRFKGINLWEFN